MKKIKYLFCDHVFRCATVWCFRGAPAIFSSLLFWSSLIYASDTYDPYPECFPMDSAWENIELASANLSDRQHPTVEQDERMVTLTFNKFESYLPQFYGFSFLKDAVSTIPEVTEHAAFEKHFRGVNLVPLVAIKSAVDEETKVYRFSPPSNGTWVIYLVAALQRIPFLEQQNLRISPMVENIRGGSIFSGSSLNLVEPIDYKACVVPLAP